MPRAFATLHRDNNPLRQWLSSAPTPILDGSSPETAPLLRMYPPGHQPCCGAVRSDHINEDVIWHHHDMHQLVYAFESAITVETATGRHLIPRQLAAWVPAGVTHRMHFRLVSSGSVFFTDNMVANPGQRVRTMLVSPLLREMMKEAMRWKLEDPQGKLRTDFFRTMAGLCSEWINGEADLFLPSCEDARLQRAVNYTTENLEAKLPEICRHAGVSDRSLRRLLKAETGLCWEAYRQRIRLLRAIELLGETEMTIAEIALSCGFETQSAFARSFRKTMSEAPSEYRRRL